MCKMVPNEMTCNKWKHVKRTLKRVMRCFKRRTPQEWPQFMTRTSPHKSTSDCTRVEEYVEPNLESLQGEF